MTHEWPMVPLGEVMSQFQDYIDSPEPREYPKLSVKLYGRGVVLDEPADGATLLMKRHQIAKAGQVILSEIWGKKGAIGFVPPEGEGALCTSHFFLFDVHTDKIDPKWLQAIFTANYLQDQLDAEAKGTTGYAAVRPKNLLAATIPLPPLDQQRRLVARIEALAAKIEEARGLRRLAVEEAEALLASERARVFAQIDLARYGKSISELAVFLDGRRIPLNAKQRADKKPGDIPYYGASGVVDYINEWIFDETLLLVSEDGANIELRSKPIAFIIRGKTWVNNHAHVLRLPTEETAIFLTHYIESLDMRPYWQGATRPKINKSALEAMVIPVMPPKSWTV